MTRNDRQVDIGCCCFAGAAASAAAEEEVVVEVALPDAPFVDGLFAIEVWWSPRLLIVEVSGSFLGLRVKTKMS